MEDNQIGNGQCQTQEGDVLAYLSSISVLFRCPKPVILPMKHVWKESVGITEMTFEILLSIQYDWYQCMIYKKQFWKYIVHIDSYNKITDKTQKI